MLNPLAFSRLAVLLCALSVASVVLAAPVRDRQRFDDNWRFKLDDSISQFHNEVNEWLWTSLTDPYDTSVEKLAPSFDDGIWKTAHSGDDVFNGRRGFALLQTTLKADFPKPEGGSHYLHFESVDDNATVYINGHRVLHHEGWNDPFDVPLNDIKQGESFSVAVIDENTDGPGGIGPVWFYTEAPENQPTQVKPTLDDSGWRTIHLPHDFVIEGTFTPDADPGHGALPRGVGWYRKTFAMPVSDKGKSVWIDFDGAFSDAHVYLNGKLLGAHRSGYSGFRFDLSNELQYGASNVIAVRCDARKTEGWWYEGGGLYRHVWLTTANPVHVSPEGGIYVTTTVDDPLAETPQGKINVTIQVENTSEQMAPCQVIETVVRPNGSVAATSKGQISLNTSDGTVQSVLEEPEAKLWSLEKPQMYTLKTEVCQEGRKVDEVDTPFGIRTLRWDASNGFFLNEKPVKLKGTCNHQDFAGVGTGMTDSILSWRIHRLKEMGSNAYRCSHNEVAAELLDACDRQGMLVMDENREFGDTFSGKASPGTTANNLSDFKQEILRDRNHPSVILWSICNEEFAVQTDPSGLRIGQVYTDLAHQLDPTRCTTAAVTTGAHGSFESKALDVEGFNYGPWEYERYHKEYPNRAMFGSETASTVGSRGEYANDKVHGYVRAYDTEGTNTAEDAWEPIAKEPYNAGGFVWTGFDYKGEPSPYGWPCVNSHFGIIDLCGFPKDNFYYYKAWWGDQPLVHIEPHWNWAGKEGQPVDVWAFGNGDSVELFLNGKSLGAKEMPKYRHVSWSVPYEPGTLVAKAITNGKVIATDTVSTTSEPVALKVTTNRASLIGDNEDCSMLEVSVVDSKGRTVPTASNLVTFSVDGPAWIAGVGNGDPSSHEPDRASERHAFNGRCLGIVQAKNQSGPVRVTLRSPGLKSIEITLKVGGSREH